MTVTRVARGLCQPVSTYPLLALLRLREEVYGLRRAGRITAVVAEQRLSQLQAREQVALDDLRRILADYRGVTQEKVARALRVDRTMVNKVWNSGRPGRGRQWVRSARTIAGTYRALEAAGWRVDVEAKTA